MNKDEILAALVGLIGAINNNGALDDSYQIIKDSLLNYKQNIKIEETVALIHKHKFMISPGCASCQHPCGNTSDYDLNLLIDNKDLKFEMINLLIQLLENESDVLKYSDLINKVIFYFGYDLKKESYIKTINEIKGYLNV